MVTNLKGDLLDANVDYICHQVNCQRTMGSGIAKAIRDRWPQVYEAYKEKIPTLGTILWVQVQGGQKIINMYSQDNFGYDGKRYTNYEAFYTSLESIARIAPKGAKIGFPKNIGCCRGGANWEIISLMIEKVLGKDYEVYIYEK